MHSDDFHFDLLFDEHAHRPPYLPEPIRQRYGGDWHPLAHQARPYTFINFVTSRDGRVSFAEPGHVGGSDVADFCAADIWLMGLLRAGADAVMMGDGTLRAEPHHLWTSEHIFPAAAEDFAAMRRALGLRPLPLHVFLSLDGEIAPDAAVFHDPRFQIVIATTSHGAPRAAALLRRRAASVQILDLGETSVDLPRLMRLLHTAHSVRSLLCEGGPRVYASMLKAGLVDEEFLTLSPVMIGSEPGKLRPSLVEGVAFAPGTSPRAELISLRRVKDHLFLRSRWTYRHER